ncbi:MAG: 2-oxoacid:acceptor oxidoreductase family protein [Phycisphaerales bacterium JB039]
MFQVRMHGRAGQGVVTGAETLSRAAFLEGSCAQVLLSFGPQRAGTPVVACCLIDDRPIRLEEPIMDPDVVIIADPAQLEDADALEALCRTDWALVNTLRSGDAAALADSLAPRHCLTVPATHLASEHLGRPIPNTALLGALCATAMGPRIEFLEQAIMQKFSGLMGAWNVRAARAGHAHLRSALRAEAVHAQA